MIKIELSQIFLELEHEINRLNLSTIAIYGNTAREEAKQVIMKLKKDIDNWIILLNNRTIACYELETLLESKRSTIELKRLVNKGISPDEIEEIKGDILRLIAKAIMNSYLDTLFRNQNTPQFSGGEFI